MPPPPVYVLPPLLNSSMPVAPAPPNELADLLRQLIAVQQEQVALMKAQAAGQANRWKALLARWVSEFPEVGAACGQVAPAVERAFLTLVRELTEKLTDDPETLTDEFVVSEFLDRYGTRFVQLGNVLNQLVTLADAAPPGQT